MSLVYFLCIHILIVIGFCICLKLLKLAVNFFEMFKFAKYIRFRNSFWILFLVSMAAKFLSSLIGIFDSVKYYLAISTLIILIYYFIVLLNKQTINKNIPINSNLLRLTQFA